MTSLLCWRTPFSRSTTSPRKCCHSNSKGSALKLLPFNKFLYICRKSHQIWLNYLSLSLSYGQNTSEHPLGRMGQAFQNAERNRWQRPTGLTHLTHGSLHFWIEWQRVSFRITSGMHSSFVSALLFYIESEMFTLRLPVVFFSI